MNQTDLIQRTVVAFLECGRGAVVILLADPEPIYVRAHEAVAQLSGWKAEAEIIDAVTRATASYDAGHEAVVIREDAISFTVTIERRDDTKPVDAITWSAVN